MNAQTSSFPILRECQEHQYHIQCSVLACELRKSSPGSCVSVRSNSKDSCYHPHQRVFSRVQSRYSDRGRTYIPGGSRNCQRKSYRSHLTDPPYRVRFVMAGSLGMAAIRPAAPALIRSIANLPSTTISRPVASMQMPSAYSRKFYSGGRNYPGLIDINGRQETSRKTNISIIRSPHVPVYNRKLTISAGLAARRRRLRALTNWWSLPA